jgi:seryl-tRNA synthetase
MCDSGKHWATHEGLATLDPLAVRLKDLLDASFLNIAASLQAERMQFPPLLKVADVDALDYFKNFPQLPLLVSATDAQAMNDRRESSREAWTEISHDCLAHATHILPPAACYPVYSHHRDAPVGRLKTITTAANCYRNESHYLGLRRLKSFSMREIVFIGEMEPVTRALSLARGRVHDLAGALGVETRLENAMDPFFDPNSTRAVTQKMFPTKQEMVYGDDLAISSSNFHRNFFGQRFNISSVDGQTAYTACIGMGLERWIHAMLEVYGNDIERAIARLEALEDELAAAPEADAALA